MMMKLLSLVLLTFCACKHVTPSVSEGPGRPAPPSNQVPRSAREDMWPVQWDAAAGKLTMQINHVGDDFLYVISLPAGVGSNPIGLDRGEEGGTHLVHFERVGPKVLLIESNTRVRALGVVGLQSRQNRRQYGDCRCHRIFSERYARRRRSPPRDAAGFVFARSESQRDLLAAYQILPEEHRGGGDPDVRNARSARAARERRDARAAARDRSRASFARRTAAARLQATQARSARQRVRRRVQRLREPVHRSDRKAVDRATSTRKERSKCTNLGTC